MYERVARIPFINKRLKGISVFHVKDHKTGYIPGLEPFSHLGAKRLRLLKESWAETFRWDVLPELPVHLLTPHYSADQGRPTKELYAMMGMMVLKEMNDLTDEEAISQFAFSIKWHYALNITETDDSHAYVCLRSLREMRAIMSEFGLEQELFQAVADKLANLYDVNPSLQRLDSTHLCSNMRKLGRVSLFVTTIKQFLTSLKRHHADAFKGLDEELRQRYLSKKGDAAFAAMTSCTTNRKLKNVAQDLWELINQFHDQDAITSRTSYKHMVRLFNEQCVETENANGEAVAIEGQPAVDATAADDGTAETATDTSEETDIACEEAGDSNEETASASEEVLPVMPKPAKEIPSDSLQNPSDPDASYDGHKGQGFQVQIMETCTESAEEQGLSLITHVAVEQAHIHDGTAVMPAIEHAQQNGLVPNRLLVDAAYGSDENLLLAAEQGVELISPTLGTEDTDRVSLDAFSHDDESRITQCPQNHLPTETKQGKKDGLVARFSTEKCSNCPLLNRCRVKEGKKGFYLRYTKKDLRLAARRAYEKSDAFKKLYAMRAGIEAGNSEAKQITGLGRLRVRGMKAVRFAVTMKLVGINIRRATAFKLRQKDPKGPNSEDNASISSCLHRWMGDIHRNSGKYIVHLAIKLKIENIFAHKTSALAW